MTGECVNVFPSTPGFQRCLKFTDFISVIFPVQVDGGVRELVHKSGAYPLAFRRRIFGPDDGDNRMGGMEGMEEEDDAFQVR